ncbi:MAG: acyl-CoA reductase [Deltaproteobacteria bacterium]|nr:acyl-CoA reductase [Deltaproteobacteria bacterium]
MSVARGLAWLDVLRGAQVRDALVDAMVEDTGVSRAMACWGLERLLARADASSLENIAARGDLQGQRAAVALATSVATAPLRTVLVLVLRGAREIALGVREGSSRTARVLARLSDAGADLVRVTCAVEDTGVWLAREVTAGAGCVVVFGGDARVARLRGGVPSGVRFEGHGHGMGGAWVGQETLGDWERVRALAWDFAAFDGVGCLSPERVWVEGSVADCVVAAERIGRAMAAWEGEMARGVLSAEWRVRERAWRAQTAAGAVSFVGERAWSVAVTERPVAAMGARNVLVHPAESTESPESLRGEGRGGAAQWFGAHREVFTTVVGDAGTWGALEGALGGCHARRSVPGEAQDPALDGEADPRPSVR